MIMRNRRSLYILFLTLIISLTACGKNENKNIFASVQHITSVEVFKIVNGEEIAISPTDIKIDYEIHKIELTFPSGTNLTAINVRFNLLNGVILIDSESNPALFNLLKTNKIRVEYNGLETTYTLIAKTVDMDLNKPKQLWIDAEANFQRFMKKENITFYLDKAKETGFNEIVVDVRPLYGKVLYNKTKSMPRLTQIGNIRRDADWDYLQFFIDEAHKRDLKIIASTTTFTIGRSSTREGPAYESSAWDGKTTLLYKSTGMIDIKNDPSQVAVFLNPLLPEVQEYALTFIKEIVTNYDIDGYALDYCRYCDETSDFSEASRKAFEEYIGTRITNFPQDIMTWSGGQRIEGKYAKKWYEFRSKIIHDFVKKAKETIKAIKPEVQLQYWAASWYGALYTKGQNWASKKYNTSLEYPAWATPEYKNTGFAEHLDVFIIGTYLETVYGMSDPESIEYGLANGRRILYGDCKMYGSIYANNKDNVKDASYLCLRNSDGLMVFDIVQVIDFDLWDELKAGIDAYESSMKK